jgi:hypothetical protein
MLDLLLALALYLMNYAAAAASKRANHESSHASSTRNDVPNIGTGFWATPRRTRPAPSNAVPAVDPVKTTTTATRAQPIMSTLKAGEKYWDNCLAQQPIYHLEINAKLTLASHRADVGNMWQEIERLLWKSGDQPLQPTFNIALDPDLGYDALWNEPCIGHFFTDGFTSHRQGTALGVMWLFSNELPRNPRVYPRACAVRFGAATPQDVRNGLTEYLPGILDPSKRLHYDYHRGGAAHEAAYMAARARCATSRKFREALLGSYPAYLVQEGVDSTMESGNTVSSHAHYLRRTIFGLNVWGTVLMMLRLELRLGLHDTAAPRPDDESKVANWILSQPQSTDEMDETDPIDINDPRALAITIDYEALKRNHELEKYGETFDRTVKTTTTMEPKYTILARPSSSTAVPPPLATKYHRSTKPQRPSHDTDDTSGTTRSDISRSTAVQTTNRRLSFPETVDRRLVFQPAKTYDRTTKPLFLPGQPYQDKSEETCTLKAFRWLQRHQPNRVPYPWILERQSDRKLGIILPLRNNSQEKIGTIPFPTRPLKTKGPSGPSTSRTATDTTLTPASVKQEPMDQEQSTTTETDAGKPSLPPVPTEVDPVHTEPADNDCSSDDERDRDDPNFLVIPNKFAELGNDHDNDKMDTK